MASVPASFHRDPWPVIGSEYTTYYIDRRLVVRPDFRSATAPIRPAAVRPCRL